MPGTEAPDQDAIEALKGARSAAATWAVENLWADEVHELNRLGKALYNFNALFWMMLLASIFSLWAVGTLHGMFRYVGSEEVGILGLMTISSFLVTLFLAFRREQSVKQGDMIVFMLGDFLRSDDWPRDRTSMNKDFDPTHKFGADADNAVELNASETQAKGQKEVQQSADRLILAEKVSSARFESRPIRLAIRRFLDAKEMPILGQHGPKLILSFQLLAISALQVVQVLSPR
jgi:hypothetical protein